jgi:hypothetical protein
MQVSEISGGNLADARMLVRQHSCCLDAKK